MKLLILVLALYAVIDTGTSIPKRGHRHGGHGGHGGNGGHGGPAGQGGSSDTDIQKRGGQGEHGQGHGQGGSAHTSIQKRGQGHGQGGHQERGKSRCPAHCRHHGIKPACDRNGNVYKNWCELRKAHCEDNTIKRGRCAACNYYCTKEMNQQCGSDGKTYNNPCLLRIATCESKGDIILRHKGACSGNKG